MSKEGKKGGETERREPPVLVTRFRLSGGCSTQKGTKILTSSFRKEGEGRAGEREERKSGDREKREGPLREDKREKGHKGPNGMKQRNENRSCTLSSGSSAERKRHFARVWDDNFESLKEFMQQHRYSHQTWPAVALVHIFACLCIMNTHARMCAHGHSVCGRT